MRSRVLPARALTRLLTGQQQQSSSSSTSTATASAATSSTTISRSVSRVASTSTFTSGRVSRASMVSRRRSESFGVPGSLPLRRRRSTSSRSRPDTSAASSMMVVDPTKVWKHTSEQFSVLKLHGIAPVSPPRTTLTNVALQNFFAAQRPLLEHEVVGSSTQQIDMSDHDAIPDEETRTRLESISQALMRSLHKSGRISAQDLDNATVVIASVDDMNTSLHAKRVEGLDQARFVKLLDRLTLERDAGAESLRTIRAEAHRMEEQERQKKDVETAVNNALERGEDTSLAQALGTEADLVVLGEPEGPNPAWARGVATHMAHSTRAYVPPSEAISASQADADIVQTEDGTTASIKIIDEREDDPNLILSHAMVQATLPPALSWDRIVAKMDAASSGKKEKPVVDLDALNADLLNHLISQVSLDSTKRKRGKKMRKHKYRKLRKATRIERSRLKK